MLFTGMARFPLMFSKHEEADRARDVHPKL